MNSPFLVLSILVTLLSASSSSTEHPSLARSWKAHAHLMQDDPSNTFVCDWDYKSRAGAQFVESSIQAIQLRKAGLGEVISACFPSICSAEDFGAARTLLKSFGLESFKKGLQSLGHLEGDEIAAGLTPRNPFARYAFGKETPAYPARQLEAAGLAHHEDSFMIVQTREDDSHKTGNICGWKMLVPRTSHWSLFNSITLGLAEGFSLAEAIDLVQSMDRVAREYAAAAGWSDNVWTGFHVYPFNSIQLLHMHIVDMDNQPSFYHHLDYKSMSTSEVLKQLQAELAAGL